MSESIRKSALCFVAVRFCCCSYGSLSTSHQNLYIYIYIYIYHIQCLLVRPIARRGIITRASCQMHQEVLKRWGAPCDKDDVCFSVMRLTLSQKQHMRRNFIKNRGLPRAPLLKNMQQPVLLCATFTLTSTMRVLLISGKVVCPGNTRFNGGLHNTKLCNNRCFCALGLP